MTTKEQIIALLDELREDQLHEILGFALVLKDEVGRTFREHTKSISLDQDMIDAIEDEFPIKRSSSNE